MIFDYDIITEWYQLRFFGTELQANFLQGVFRNYFCFCFATKLLL